MKISLIIPAYNEEGYINNCLESAVKNSNGKFLEIIVIDNASTDETAHIAAKFKEVRVIREEKKGLTEARERGRLEATGDILAYIDADTKMPESWMEILEKSFQNNPNLACLSGPYRYYDLSRFEQLLITLYWRILAAPSAFFIGYMVVGGNFAIRKDVLEKMKGFDTTIAFYGEDTNIGRRASEFGIVKFDPSFYMPTSGRRFKGQGLFRTGYIYVINFLSEVFLHRPATDEYTDIR